MDVDAQKEINDLKAALIGVSSALHQLRMYVIEGKQPTADGRKLFDDYLSQIDRVVTPGAIRGLGRP